MTTEVSIMNTQAVAMAADSAVTISTNSGNSQKIFNSVNKLFALSKYRPVGVMIYGSASFMGIPWETLIKVYRQQLSDESKELLEDYVADFLKYVSGLTKQSSELNQMESMHVHSIFKLFKERLEELIFEALDGKNNQEAEELFTKIFVDKVDETIQEAEKFVDNLGQLESALDHNAEERIAANLQTVSEIWTAVFAQLPIPEDRREKIYELVIKAVPSEKFFTGMDSGIVIAGFGEAEIFPVQVEYNVEGFLFGVLKHSQKKVTTISPSNRAVVSPFAQGDVIANFMQGVDPNFFKSIKIAFNDMTTKLIPQAVEASLQAKGIDAATIDTVVEEFRINGSAQAVEIQQKLDLHSRDWHVDPIIDAVGFLPKEELAQLAESLVNLTSVRRRMSTNAETVGGPVDVAVISKGDGLIWIKRKHYFDPALNNHFFNNYYKE